MSETYATTLMPQEIMIDESLSLRYISPDDAEDLFRIIQADPEISRNVSWPAQSRDLASTRQAIECLLEKPKDPYVLQEQGVTVGFVGTWDSEDNDGHIGLSYFLAKDKRGHGYITRAVGNLMQAVCENRTVDVFVSNIMESNEPSKKLAASLGFMPAATVEWFEELQATVRRWERPAYE